MSKILAVDDSAMTRDAIARLLGSVGYTVSTAQSGKVAWMMLYADLPDLIVLDLMMPDMGGLTFLRMLRSHHHWKDLPVLVLTGLDPDEAMVENARELGVVDVIQKGSNTSDLLLQHIGRVLPAGKSKRARTPRSREAVCAR
jgi:CheY-like chemotaxis protein